MKEIVEKIAKNRRLFTVLLVALVVVLAAVVFWSFDRVRAREVAQEKARVEAERQLENQQKAALQEYFLPRLKMLETLQKKRASNYRKPTRSQRNLSIAAIFVDNDGDGIPELCIDHPALSYESKDGKYTRVSYDGMYMGNVSVALYAEGKIWTVPQKLRKKIRDQKLNIHPVVYVSGDQRTISIVFQRAGAETLWDGYLYKVDENGIREVARQFDVRDNAPSNRIGSMKITPEFKAFQRKFFLKDAAVYKEMLSYDQEGNMKIYHSMDSFRETLRSRGILPEEGGGQK